MKYTDRNRKKITLPSGGEITIAKLNGFSAPFLEARRGEDDGARGMRLAVHCLTNPANGLLRFEGEDARIVNKETAAPGEVTIAEMDQADADKIVNEVIAFSGLNAAGQEARKTFPEGPAPGGEPAPVGEALRGAADGAGAVAAG